MPARYRIQRKIADGGMAEIFLATQHGAEGFERRVVLKRILQALLADPKFRNMMIDEAHVAMSLNHSNIVQVLDLGQSRGRYFLVLELCDGWDLNYVLNRCKVAGVAMPAELALYVVAEVCRALAYAHARTRDGKPLGIVHRDISPHNVLVSEQGEVKLADFGIAKALGRRERTGQGVIKGKLAFMSPEQASGAALDARSDLFSVGTSLYLMFVGKKPFDAATDLETILRVQQAKFTPALEAKPDLDPELARIIDKSMRMAPSERYQTAEELLIDLESAQRTVFKPAGQTELKRWLAELSAKDSVPPISRAKPLPSDADDEELDLIEGVDIVFEEVLSEGSAPVAASAKPLAAAAPRPPVPTSQAANGAASNVPEELPSIFPSTATVVDKPPTASKQIPGTGPGAAAGVEGGAKGGDAAGAPAGGTGTRTEGPRRRTSLAIFLGIGALTVGGYVMLFRRGGGTNDAPAIPPDEPPPPKAPPASPPSAATAPPPSATATPAPAEPGQATPPAPQAEAATTEPATEPASAPPTAPPTAPGEPAATASPAARPTVATAGEELKPTVQGEDDEEALLERKEPDVAEKVIEEGVPAPAPPPPPPRRSGAKPPPAPPPPAHEPVMVRIESRPEGAVVKLHERVFGRAPLNLRFNSGITYELTFIKSGYESNTKRFTVTKRKNQKLVASLKKRPPPKKRGLLQRLFGG